MRLCGCFFTFLFLEAILKLSDLRKVNVLSPNIYPPHPPELPSDAAKSEMKQTHNIATNCFYSCKVCFFQTEKNTFLDCDRRRKPRLILGGGGGLIRGKHQAFWASPDASSAAAPGFSMGSPVFGSLAPLHLSKDFKGHTLLQRALYLVVAMTHLPRV